MEEKRDSTVFDRRALLERLDNDEELVDEIVDLYLDDATGRIGDLQEAIRAGDAVRLQRDGHSLKGASANAGAEMIREVATQIEQAGRSGDLDRAAALVSKAGEALDVFRRVVAEAKSKTPQG
ncbi:MAG: Hpt domain-containing protein [Candidatus Eisenbacteria bacterium]